MKLMTLLLVTATLISSVGFSKPADDFFSHVNAWPTYPEKWLAETKWADPALILKPAAKNSETPAKTSVRGAASSEQKEAAWYEAKMSEPYKHARKDFLAAKTSDELDALLVTLDKNYNSYPTDLKFFAAQIIPLRTMRGIVWKMVPAIENTKILHSTLLTVVKQWAVNQKLLFPASQWNAGMDYITQPYMENGAVTTRFADEAYIQGYTASVIYTVLKKAHERILELDMRGNDIVFDSQFIFGASKAPEAIDQYKVLGEVERWATLSSLSAAMAQISMNRAFSMQGAFEMDSEIGKEYGLDSFFKKVDGVPAEKVVKIINSPAYPNWGRRFPDFKAHLALSRNHTRDAVIYAQRMISEMEGRQGNEEFFADSNFPIPYTRGTKYQLTNMLAMLDTPKELRSAATGETAVVDVPSFFDDPPKSLKMLYAVHFEDGLEMVPFKVNGVEVTKYRNYLKGRPDQWRLDIYKKYFPGLKSNADLRQRARVLSQTWGAQLVVIPLLTYFQ